MMTGNNSSRVLNVVRRRLRGPRAAARGPVAPRAAPRHAPISRRLVRALAARAQLPRLSCGRPVRRTCRPNAKSPPAPRGRLDMIERRRGTGGGMILHSSMQQRRRAHARGSLQQRESHAIGGRRWCARLAVRLQARAARRPPRALLATESRQRLLVCCASWSGRSSSPARRGLARAGCGARRWTRTSAASCCAARRESPTESCRTSRQRASRAEKVSARDLDLRTGEIIFWRAAWRAGAAASARSGRDSSSPVSTSSASPR